MSPLAIGGIGIAAILVLIAARVPIGLALSAVAFAGVAAIIGLKATFDMLGTLPYAFSAH